MFGTIVFIPICLMIDRPIYSLLNLKRDIKDAEKSQYYKLTEYMQNFKEVAEDTDPLTYLATFREAKVEEIIVEVPADNRDASIFQNLKGGKKVQEGLGDSGREATRAATNPRDTSARDSSSKQEVRFTKEFDLDQVSEKSD